ncbi:hypothetical protein [Terrisporobacter mayombei]|uniref:Lipoprotein n=1 Tax=Terrisporobacter mayombei TaxID=1541 RepID=A0ABY9PZM0_9FIRM|nr:hypothetical protein [Terrisporobacter mayombei]MCC3866584.1 hypothetical protein [Terrisporobacter mayombei]WMT80819.1 hypothetical protein TEMA_11410 [Terrisporobacter mayombei]
MKSIFKKSILCILMLGLVGCNSTNSSTDLADLKTPEEVNKAYEANKDKLENEEKLQDLNINSFDEVAKYANKSKEITSDLEKTEDKVKIIDKLVALDDLYSNTSKDIKQEAMNYLIDQYKNEKLADDLEDNYYLASYIASKSDPDNADIYDIAKVMKDYIKDTMMLVNNEYDQNNKGALLKTLNDNKKKLDENMNVTTKIYPTSEEKKKTN